MIAVYLTLAGTVLASSQFAPIEIANAFSSNQKTLTSFAGTSTALSSKQKSEIKALLSANPLASSVVCTGLITKGSSQTVVNRVKNRANASCNYAKSLDSALSISTTTKLTTSKSSAGKVVVSLKAGSGLPQVTLDALHPSNTKLIANQIVAGELKAMQVPNDSVLQIRKGPSLREEDLAGPKLSLLNTVGAFSSIYKPALINVNWFTSSDADWVDQAIEESGANPRWTPTRELYSSWIKSVRTCNMGNAGLGSKGPFINQCLRSGSPPSHDYETASHEFFHVVQSEVSGSRLPHWFVEGSATFVGIHVGGQSFGDFATTRSKVIGRWSTGLDQPLLQAIRSKDKSFIENRFKELEASQVEAGIQNSGYALGMLAYEALVAAHGWQKFLQHLQDIKSLGFQGSLEKNYGLPTAELYKKLAPYVISQLGSGS